MGKAVAVSKCCTLNFPAVPWSSPFCRPSVPLRDTISLILHHQSGRLIPSPHSLQTPSRPWRGVICHGSHWSVLEESRDCSAQGRNSHSPCRCPHCWTRCPTSGFVHLSVGLDQKRPLILWCCLNMTPIAFPMLSSQTPENSGKRWMRCGSAVCPLSESSAELPPEIF